MTMENCYENFRKNLKALLDEHGMNAHSLSTRISVTAATLSRYLHAQRNPEIQCIYEIAKYFNVSIDWLFGISGTDEAA